MTTPGRRVPIKSVGGHGQSDGTPYPFGLEPDVALHGWNAQPLTRLPGWCAEKCQPTLAVWMPWGNEGSPIRPDMWRHGTINRVKVCNEFALDEFVGNLNSDANCEPILYLPPLPRADGMGLNKWLVTCRDQACRPLETMHRNGRRFSVCFDTLGAAGKPDDPGRYYLYALVESLLRQGVKVGIEPPGEHQTLWHDFPDLFGWVTPWYLLGHEDKPGGWSDHRWTPGKGRTIYVNQTPEYEQHTARWLSLGYHILTPVHIDHWNATTAQGADE